MKPSVHHHRAGIVQCDGVGDRYITTILSHPFPHTPVVLGSITVARNWKTISAGQGTRNRRLGPKGSIRQLTALNPAMPYKRASGLSAVCTHRRGDVASGAMKSNTKWGVVQLRTMISPTNPTVLKEVSSTSLEVCTIGAHERSTHRQKRDHRLYCAFNIQYAVGTQASKKLWID